MPLQMTSSESANSTKHVLRRAFPWGFTVLRLISREDGRRAGLALISTIRKRLLSLPNEVAADETLRVRAPNAT